MMTDLYIRPGTNPQRLPFSAKDDTGRLWTDLANSEEGRIATGWDAIAAEKPYFDPATQTLRWVETDQVWLVEALPPPPPPSTEDVNAERDRRIRAGFAFGGKPYDYNDAAQKRITGAATLAGFASVNGAQPGDMLWHGGSDPFFWIAQDNALVPMDAQTCFAFGQTAAAHESAHVFAARALKDAEGNIPADFADDSHWPLAG